MEIKQAQKKGSATLSKMDIYRLTRDPSTESIQRHIGELIKPVMFCLYDDVNDKGETMEVLAISDGILTFSTISDVFKREFFECVKIADGADFEIEILKGETKAGRMFVTCRLNWIDEG